MNKKQWTPEEYEKFRSMCFAGISNKKIAEAFGCTVAAIQHRRSRWGLTMAAVEKAKAEAETGTGTGVKAAAGKEPIDDIPTPPKPILSTRSAKAPEEQMPADKEEKIEISAEAFFALAHELSENAEKMEKLSANNLTLKEQLLNQSQRIAELQDYIEGLQVQTAKHQEYISGIEEEMGSMSTIATFLMEEDTHKCHYMGRGGLYRLFHRYEPLCRCRRKETEKKEAENAGND